MLDTRYKKIDERYMRIALKLARKGKGRISPNPMVGAVVVKDGKIIGKGWHKFFGGPHAEIYALSQAGDRAKGATLYVNLEPCNHFGKTPPCTDVIIRLKIKRVVVGCKDPNPVNNGSGIKKLRRAGIVVDVGLLEEESKELNTAFIKYITKGLPYVVIKVAQSLDGKIATKKGESKWITGEKARRYVHKLRSQVDAILVGVNTITRDDPLLTPRLPFTVYRLPNRTIHEAKRLPIKVILDSKLRTPANAKIFSKESPAKVIIAAKNAPKEKAKALQGKGAEIIKVAGKDGKVDIKRLLRQLAKRGIASVLIEGGGETIASVLGSGVVDKILFFIAPKIIGGRSALTSVEGEGVKRIDEALRLIGVKFKRFGEDILVEGYLTHSG